MIIFSIAGLSAQSKREVDVQTVTISGRVRDKVTAESLVGASVYEVRSRSI